MAEASNPPPTLPPVPLPQNPPNQPPPAPAPTQPPPAPTIPLSVEEYQRLRNFETQFAELQKAQQLALEAKEQERVLAMAQKGQVEEALSQQRTAWEQKHAESVTKYATLEKQVFDERLDNVLTSALQGRKLLGETPEAAASTANMVRRLLRDDFETVRDAGGSLVVREKRTGRPAPEVLRERLDSPQFAIFFAATNRGGSGAGQAGAERPPGEQKSNLDMIAEDFHRRMNQFASFGLRAQSK